jgi:hypothetical protein
MQGKQAKIVSPTQERAMLGYLATTRYPSRDRVMFLLSMKAGLRAKAMASLTWAMVTDATGQVAEVLHVPNRASKCNGLQWKWLRTAINGNLRPDYLHLSIPSGRDYLQLRLLLSSWDCNQRRWDHIKCD